ncbi:hypothetical protein DAPPUDRAFT_323187 [Daphnia pulex]|uniref:Uncharacterized protein n=1 Tax=Daphnia pulex TaxID=6669 RepID=E9GY54_DAPPU|nr:hypothetical protein DAPPUDRAFT_323187 [Daphnia pulex]|eukprot:EFX75541.1 hypothetical protein DAPPUDRAFT_323187 [Daphnia pulex]
MSPPLTFNKVSNHPPSFMKPMLSIISKADKLCQQKKTVPVSSKGDNVKHAYEHHADDIEVPEKTVSETVADNTANRSSTTHEMEQFLQEWDTTTATADCIGNSYQLILLWDRVVYLGE